MIRYVTFICSALLGFFSHACLATSNPNSPVGYWQTVDDVSGRVQSIIEIYVTPNQTVAGKIVQTFPEPGIKPLITCDLCQGDLQGKPLVGMTILRDLHQAESNLWNEGTIVDPKSGNVYHCFFSLGAHGKTLTIRGYVLFHWMGRSQTWLRIERP